MTMRVRKYSGVPEYIKALQSHVKRAKKANQDMADKKTDEDTDKYHAVRSNN